MGETVKYLWNVKTNTTNATIPAGWVQVPFFVVSGKSNVTSTNTSDGTSTTMETSRYTRNILVAWTSANKAQVDDIIGVTKVTVTAMSLSMT